MTEDRPGIVKLVEDYLLVTVLVLAVVTLLIAAPILVIRLLEGMGR